MFGSLTPKAALTPRECDPRFPRGCKFNPPIGFAFLVLAIAKFAAKLKPALPPESFGLLDWNGDCSGVSLNSLKSWLLPCLFLAFSSLGDESLRTFLFLLPSFPACLFLA